ncbi:serine/threonine-protein kinase [Tautonia sociabilis]|uniref:Serine/threonine protein kinase n=1 Tax=Tautonia sociabilis TaxID=2080755 RepID=A0A432MKC4_9BACT|nr:serine/threonine-protein kinase [Tautonia sociabilis]RUL87851.1 serine/threonine protein kinase [Tautonia sociabilis]
MASPSRHLKLWFYSYLKAFGISGSPGGPAPDPDAPDAFGEKLRRAEYALRWLERRRPRRAREDVAPTDADGLAALSFPLDLGPFRVLRELGRGGFGVVLLAHRIPDGPLQALKLPRPEFLVSDEMLEQFHLEARVAMMFDHPNLIRVSEVGTIGPLHYICSPYYPGPTLAQWLESRGGPVPIADAVAIIADVGEALQHAHDRGVLHRDLSPHNIILVSAVPSWRHRGEHAGAGSREGLHPMLGDFGLSRPMGQGDVPPEGLIGALGYLAPEEIDPSLGEVGPASDLFALCAVFYELLTGAPFRPVWHRKPDLRQLVRERPIPPRALRPDLPESLEEICVRGLAERPSDRFPSIGRFVQALRQFDRADYPSGG